MKFLFCITLGAFFLLVAGCQSSPVAHTTAPSIDFSPGPPSRATFTIELARLSGPERYRFASVLQQRGRQLWPGQEIWICPDQEVTTVNYGRFPSHQRAERELDKVKAQYARLQPGRYQFYYVKHIPEPDPPAPDYWNLLNADCAYTLEIGTYYDVPEKNYTARKVDAVAAVQKIRNETNEKAFFVHGRNESRVYVGCLPEQAVQFDRQQGKRVIRVASALKPWLEKYPYRRENSAVVYNITYDADGEKIRSPRPSRLRNVDRILQHIDF